MQVHVRAQGCWMYAVLPSIMLFIPSPYAVQYSFSPQHASQCMPNMMNSTDTFMGMLVRA